MMILVFLIWALLLPLLLGVLVLSFIDRKSKISFGFLQYTSYSFFLGTSLFTLILFLLSVANISWDSLVISLLLGVLVIGVLYKLHRNNLKQKINRVLDIRVYPQALQVIVLLLILLKLFLLFYLATNKPIIDWDAWSNWSLRARVFYTEQGINLDKHSPYYLGSGGHLDYPLQLPILEAWIFLVLNSWRDDMVKIIFPLYLAFFSAYLYSFLSKRISNLQSLIYTFIFISLPLLSFHTTAAYIDLPLSLYVGIGTMLLLEFVETRKKIYLFLSSVILGCAAWLKNEGLIFYLIFSLFSLVLIYFFSKKKFLIQIRDYTLHIVSGLIFVLPWLIFKLIKGIETSSLLKINFADFNIHPEILSKLVNGIISPSNFSLLWLAFILSLLMSIALRDKKMNFTLSLLPVLFLLAFVLIYLITDNYRFVIDGTVLQRNLLTIAPTTFWLTALLLGNYFERVQK